MENPVAAPQGTEAIQTNTNPTPAPAAEQPQAPAQAPQAPVANIPADQIEAFNRFVGSNGGFESAFAKLKSAVSAPKVEQNVMNTPAPNMANPAMQPQAQQQYAQQQPYAPQPVQQKQYRTPVGYMSQEELNVQRYYEDLSREPDYAPIADELKTGAVFKEMNKFGIKPVDENGAINVTQVRDFLDLYAKSKPAPQHSNPVSTTPTVEYVNVGETITSRDDALAVLRQNMTLGNHANHPQTAAAQEFLKNYFKK